MKKTTIIISMLILISNISFSQKSMNLYEKISSSSPHKLLLPKNGNKSLCDTATPFGIEYCNCVLSLYPQDVVTPYDSGYFVGQNVFNYSEIAQQFFGLGTGTISDVYIWFGAKAGTTGNTFVNIYDVNSSGKPGTLLGTSAIVPKSAIDTFYSINITSISDLTDYHFSTPVNIPNDFFISISIPATFSDGTDELGIATTENACCMPDDSTLCYYKGGTWNSFYHSYGVSFDMAAFPIFCSAGLSTPVADFSATDNIISTGTSLQFTDQSLNIPTNWSWALTPNTGFAYTGGTSSVSQNPQIIFNNAGTYTVALTATNSYGSNTLTRNNYINVLNSFPPSWCDTAIISSFSGTCIDSLIIYPFGTPLTPNDSGYITGQNYAHLSEFGQYFYSTPNTSISDIIVSYALKAGATGYTYAKIYSDWPYSPSTLLGTSAMIVKSAIDTSNHGKNFNNVYHFPTPISVGSNYFVSIVMPATYAYGTDELAIYNSNLSCTNDGYGFINDGTQWHQYYDILQNEIDLAIFPIVNAPPAGCYALYNIYPDTALLHHYYVTNLASGVQPLSYLWSWGDGSYDSIPYPSHTYSAAGYYNICLTITDASGGCTSTYCDSSNIQKSELSIFSLTVIPSGTTGIIEQEVNNPITIFPNPASNIITINSLQKKSEILILNIQGQLIKSMIADKSTITFDISDFAKGMYFVKVTTDNGTVTKKIIKE